MLNSAAFASLAIDFVQEAERAGRKGDARSKSN